MGVEHQAGKSVGREPDGAILVLKLRAERMRRMAAQVKKGGQGLGRACGDVKISRDVEAGQTFKDNFLDAIGVAIEAAGDLRFERSALRQGIETKHVKQLPSQLGLLLLPISERAKVIQ